MKKRTIFYLSDRTGITAETLGRSLLSQFDDIHWHEINIPFLDDLEKAQRTAQMINETAAEDGLPPVIFATLINPQIHDVIEDSKGVMYDFFDTFITSLEQVLHQESSHAIGRSHSIESSYSYNDRIDAINYAMNNDDGVSTHHYDEADIILIGVSRSGKTPTSLYFAMLYGIPAANYPLTEDDMHSQYLPECLKPYRKKLFGLTIAAKQLHKIRQERRRDSRYASLEQCRKELAWQEKMYKIERIPFLDTSSISIEEIATRIIHQAKLKRRLYG